jgi:transcriptional regulator
VYIPKHFSMPPDLLAAILATGGSGDLITVVDGVPVATHLPWVHVAGSADEPLGSLVLHVARNNDQAVPPDGQALFLITPATEFISARWYPTAPECGKLIGTWDYAAVHVYGELLRHDDLEFKRRAVAAVSASLDPGLDLTAMPEAILLRQLRAIVGLEFRITGIEAKAKLSQNRTPEDVRGVIDGLQEVGATRMAGLVDQYATPHAERRASLVAGVKDKFRPGSSAGLD